MSSNWNLMQELGSRPTAVGIGCGGGWSTTNAAHDIPSPYVGPFYRRQQRTAAARELNYNHHQQQHQQQQRLYAQMIGQEKPAQPPRHISRSATQLPPRTVLRGISLQDLPSRTRNESANGRFSSVLLKYRTADSTTLKKSHNVDKQGVRSCGFIQTTAMDRMME